MKISNETEANAEDLWIFRSCMGLKRCLDYAAVPECVEVKSSKAINQLDMGSEGLDNLHPSTFRNNAETGQQKATESGLAVFQDTCSRNVRVCMLHANKPARDQIDRVSRRQHGSITVSSKGTGHRRVAKSLGAKAVGNGTYTFRALKTHLAEDKTALKNTSHKAG